MDFMTILPFLIPIILLQVGIQIFAIIDLIRSDRRVKGGNKPVWAIVILLGNLLGALIYLFVAREEV